MSTWYRSGTTYHNGHASALNDGAEYQNTHYNTPALHPPLHSASDDDHKADQCAQLNNDTKTHQETNSAPHIAEGGIFVAVGDARERDAVARLGRAA